MTKKGPTNAVLPLCKSLDVYIQVAVVASMFVITSQRDTLYLVNKIGLSITISSQNFGVKKRRHKCMHDTTLRCLHSSDTLWFVYNKIYIHTIYVTFCNSVNGCIKLLCINHQLNRAMAMNQTEYKASGYIANIVYLVLVDFHQT